MKVRALTSFSLGGGCDVHPGDVFEMPDPAARQREKRGWVARVEPEPEKQTPGPAREREAPEHPEASGPGVVTARDPQPSHRDPPPPAERPGGKKRKE